MIFVFRNSTMENLFPKEKYILSEYESPLSSKAYETYLWMNFLSPLPSKNALLKEINKLKKNLDLSIKTANKNKISIMGLFLPEIYMSLTDRDEVMEELFKFNQHIIKLSEKNLNISYLNPDNFKKTLGEESFSSKYFFSIGSIISPSSMNNFSIWLKKFEMTTFSSRKKLLIIDLDNTLWGGVLGEDGVNGIKTDNSSYPGNVFSYLQLKLKDLSSSGVLLAICSKNNLSDVEEVFKNNKFLNISINDFTVVKANWNEKSENIRHIISQVNINEDACVFLDDNPLERDLVRNNLPNISVPDFPDKLYEIPSFLEKTFHHYFSAEKILNEDLLKKTQYEIREKAEKIKSEFSSKEEFLKNLKLEGKILTSIESVVPRVSQMTQKTNQFNFTTQRLSEDEVFKLISDGAIIYPLQVKDIYGDHGITGLIMINKKSKIEAEITNFLMSCRILGRDIEQNYLEWCIFDLKQMGFKKIKGKFISTKKNKLAEDFYKDFKVSGKKLKNKKSENNVKNFELDISDLSYKKKDDKFIEISKTS